MVKSGFIELDNLLGGGLRPGSLNILAAKPPFQTSALGFNIAANVALSPKSRRHVAILSLKLSYTDVMAHLIAAQSRMSFEKVRGAPWGEFLRVANKLNGAPLHIYASDYSLSKLIEQSQLCQSRALRATRKPLSLIVIDYVQLIQEQYVLKGRNSTPGQTNIGLALKHLARQLNVPLLAHSLLTAPPPRPPRAPLLSDIMDRGLEQAADVVAIIHPSQDMPRDPRLEAKVKIVLVKNRYGARGNMDLVYQREYALYESPASASPE